MQIEDKIIDGVHEHIQSHGSRREERLPPPPMILHAQVHVRQHHGHLRAHNDQQDQHHKQKPEYVVHPPHPNAGHDEEELNEERAEGQRARSQHQQPRRVPLPRNLSGNLIGSHREGDRNRFGAQVAPEKG